MRVLLLLLILIPANSYSVTCSSQIAQGTVETCDTIEQYGITWTLSTSESVGQFVTGDYFIVHDGSVIVSSVTPENVTGTNGSMVNPKHDFAVRGDYDFYQGLVYNQYNYDAALNVSFPLSLGAESSLLSTIEQIGVGTAWTGLAEDDSQLNTAAVLTVLATQPVSGSFRPGYAGDTKTIYNISQIAPGLLRALPTTAVTLPSHAGFTTVGYYERGLQRPWVLIGNDWLGRSLHPIMNMLDYHQHIGVFLSDAMLLSLSDLNTDALLYGLIQTGIDYYAMAINGKGDSAFFGQLIAYIGTLLQDSAMQTLFSGSNNISVPREIQNFYEGVGWNGATALFMKDGNKYEEKDPSTWVDNPDCKDETYRDGEDSQPQVGTNLAIMLLGADARLALHNDNILNYADRFMTDGFGTTYLPTVETYCTLRTFGGYGWSGSQFTNDMWAAYRGQDAPASSNKVDFTGTGTIQHGGTGAITIQ